MVVGAGRRVRVREVIPAEERPRRLEEEGEGRRRRERNRPSSNSSQWLQLENTGQGKKMMGLQ